MDSHILLTSEFLALKSKFSRNLTMIFSYRKLMACPVKYVLLTFIDIKDTHMGKRNLR